MYDGGKVIGADLADLGFVLRVLVGKGRDPHNRNGAVVVINSVFLVGFSHLKIGGTNFDSNKFEVAFVDGVDPSLA